MKKNEKTIYHVYYHDDVSRGRSEFYSLEEMDAWMFTWNWGITIDNIIKERRKIRKPNLFEVIKLRLGRA